MTPNRIVALFCVVFWLAVPVVAAHAAQPEGQVCPAMDSGKIDTPGAGSTLTITAPDGYLISGYCVKAGSAQQGLGPEFVVVDPPAASVTISHSSGKDISHYAASYVLIDGGGTDGGGTDGGSTDGGSTDGGSTDGGTDGGATDGGTDGGGGGTTGSGAGGGTTGGPAPDPAHALPHTGLPIWIPLLIAAALLLSGGILMRSKKGLDS